MDNELLKDTVLKLKDRIIKTEAGNIQLSETDTRQGLINPLFRALQWDFGDFESIKSELRVPKFNEPVAALNQGRSRLGPYREQRATRGERRGSRESEQSLSSRDRFTGQRVVLLALPRRQRRVAKNRCAPERVSPESRAGEPHAGPRREARHGVAQRRTSDCRVHETDSFRSATSPRRSRSPAIAP